MNLLYLPIVTTADGVVVGVEASAEGADALLEACVDVRDWTLEQPFRRPLTLDVRMSTAELTEPDVVEVIAELLRRSELSSAQLCVQVTEPLLMRDPERSVLVLQAIRSLGVSSRITEFGAQYVTLAYLRRFSVDGMTLDANLLATIDSDPVHRQVVAAVIGLGHFLAADVRAIGVSSAEQRSEMATLKCDTIQGPLVSPPLSPAGFSEFWDAHRAA
jgi:EAL domain-containing protein (putative c-di-GMP-specific phosphodiesterase class I)